MQRIQAMVESWNRNLAKMFLRPTIQTAGHNVVSSAIALISVSRIMSKSNKNLFQKHDFSRTNRLTWGIFLVDITLALFCRFQISNSKRNICGVKTWIVRLPRPWVHWALHQTATCNAKSSRGIFFFEMQIMKMIWIFFALLFPSSNEYSLRTSSPKNILMESQALLSGFLLSSRLFQSIVVYWESCVYDWQLTLCQTRLKDMKILTSDKEFRKP